MDGFYFRHLIDSIDNIGIRFERGTGGRVIAWVTCPICSNISKNTVKELKIIREPARSWPLYSLISHFDKHFSYVEQKDRRKVRKSKFDLSYDQSGASTYAKEGNTQIFESESTGLEYQCSFGNEYGQHDLTVDVPIQQDSCQKNSTDRLEMRNSMAFTESEHSDYAEEYLDNCDETVEDMVEFNDNCSTNCDETVEDNIQIATAAYSKNDDCSADIDLELTELNAQSEPVIPNLPDSSKFNQ